MWLDRAKWHLECMPEKFFLSLSLLSTEPAILPRKNLMFLESSRARYTGARHKCLYMWMWLDRAKWQLECMPEKFFLSLSLLSTELVILPRKNLMFLESQTSHWADMDPKTGCNKMRSAERYRPSLIGSGVWSWVQSLWPLNVMVRFFLTENVNDMKNRSYQFNMSCKINLTEAWEPWSSNWVQVPIKW